MSDQPPPHPLTEAELSARPRGLAALGKASTPGKGAQIRSRAARRRGRRAVLSTTALAAAALTCGALGSLAEQPSSPAMSAAQPSPVRTQRVTVGLDAHTLTIEGKRFTIGAPANFCPIGETTVTVAAKYPSVQLRPNKRPIGRAGARNWAVPFTDRSHQQRLLLFAMEPSVFQLSARTASLVPSPLHPRTGSRCTSPSSPVLVWRSRVGRPRALPPTPRASTDNRSPAPTDAETAGPGPPGGTGRPQQVCWGGGAARPGGAHRRTRRRPGCVQHRGTHLGWGPPTQCCCGRRGGVALWSVGRR